MVTEVSPTIAEAFSHPQGLKQNSEEKMDSQNKKSLQDKQGS